MSKTIKSKNRILQRNDGALFGWTQVLDAFPNMTPGVITIYEDGTSSIVLDRATTRIIDAKAAETREKVLLNENVRLKDQLALAQGIYGPGETPLPPMDSFDIDSSEAHQLVNTSVGEEEAMQKDEPELSGDIEILEEYKIKALNKEALISRLYQMDSNIDLPDSLKKSDLVDLCLKLQEKLKG